MNDQMMVARHTCYSVWVRIMMRRMTTTTAQIAPIMMIFYREGDTERDKGRRVLMMGCMKIEMSPQTNTSCDSVTNSLLALLLFVQQ